MKPIHVVGLGLGPGDLTPAVSQVVAQAEVLAGGSRLVDFFPDHPAERLILSRSLEKWLDQVAQAVEDQHVVVLASGDPGFFGVAARLARRFGPMNLVIHPNVSTVQAAFARLKLPWQDALVVSIHGRDDGPLYSALARRSLVAVYTDPANSPDRIASSLLQRGQRHWRMHVLEDLGTPREMVKTLSLNEAAGQSFSPLNVTVLIRIDDPETLTVGTPDERFAHQAGLITKSEIRCVILGGLAIEPDNTVWDLGAGCGSVGLEASLLAWRGRVVCVEKNPERLEQIRTNQSRFGRANVEVIAGELPGALDGLPDPHRIFVGGGGADLEAIVSKGAGRLAAGGIMVVSCVRLESLEASRKAFSEAGLQADLTLVQVGRGTPLTGDLYIKSLNPVWLVTGRKKA